MYKVRPHLTRNASRFPLISPPDWARVYAGFAKFLSILISGIVTPFRETMKCITTMFNGRIYASVATACYGVLPASFSVLQSPVNLPFLSFTNDKDIDD